MFIKDLSKELDTKTMSAVRGGDAGNSADNTIVQAQNLCVPVAVGGFGPTNSSVHVNGTQNASIWNSQYAGDSFAALFAIPVFAR
jgi:hypothetical protein